MIGSDADAGVGNGDEEAEFAAVGIGDVFAADAGDIDGDAAVFGELKGVADEGDEDLAEAGLVAVDELGDAGVDLEGEGETGGAGAGAEEIFEVVEAVAQGERGVGELDDAGLDAGDVEDIGDEGFEGDAAVLDGIDVFALLGGETGVAEEFGEADDVVDGGADFVGNDGEEFALGAVGGFGGFWRRRGRVRLLCGR